MKDRSGKQLLPLADFRHAERSKPPEKARIAYGHQRKSEADYALVAKARLQML